MLPQLIPWSCWSQSCQPTEGSFQRYANIDCAGKMVEKKSMVCWLVDDKEKSHVLFTCTDGSCDVLHPNWGSMCHTTHEISPTYLITLPTKISIWLFENLLFKYLIGSINFLPCVGNFILIFFLLQIMNYKEIKQINYTSYIVANNIKVVLGNKNCNHLPFHKICLMNL